MSNTIKNWSLEIQQRPKKMQRGWNYYQTISQRMGKKNRQNVYATNQTITLRVKYLEEWSLSEVCCVVCVFVYNQVRQRIWEVLLSVWTRKREMCVCKCVYVLSDSFSRDHTTLPLPLCSSSLWPSLLIFLSLTTTTSLISLLTLTYHTFLHPHPSFLFLTPSFKLYPPITLNHHHKTCVNFLIIIHLQWN